MTIIINDKPKIGQIIHIVTNYNLETQDCFAAIVIGNIEWISPPDRNPPFGWAFLATVFAPHGPAYEGARRIIVTPGMEWHAIEQCPSSS